MIRYLILLCGFSVFSSCVDVVASRHKKSSAISEEVKNYWFNQEAEISSYELSQARYGEMRKGKAVLVFVSEPFSKSSYTKADNPTQQDPSVLKLNFEKKFNTGIYPYSMMTSTFYPFSGESASLKVSSSSQEWCGHTYQELLNKDKFHITLNSYFESEANGNVVLEKSFIEDDFWSAIRINPDALPVGNLDVIPSFFFLRLLHKESRAYKCDARLSEEGDQKVYTLKYPELERELRITFNNTFPFTIESWEETYFSGWGDKRKKMTSTGKLKKRIKLDYWNKNALQDDHYRELLGM